jgi:large subunit ribosomal protein L15
MKLHELNSPFGATKNRKRVGRGTGSGHGTFSGRGQKGQKARSAPHIHPYFEGGQLPLSRRLPHKRGFVNIFRVEYEVVNVSALADLAGDETITPEMLVATGLVSSMDKPVKILGDGELTKAVKVSAHRLSKSAKEKITAAGGSFEELWAEPEAEKVAEKAVEESSTKQG